MISNIYVADAQLGYLYKRGIVSACISEDSDLIAFGAKMIMYKLDKDGYGDMLELEELKNFKVDPPSNSMSHAEKKKFFAEFNFILDLKKMTDLQILRMCILSGCDYLDSPPGVGLKTAIKTILRYCKDESFESMEKALSIIFQKKQNRPANVDAYKRDFKEAEHTFLYQLVFNPKSREITRLCEIRGGKRGDLLQEAGQLKSQPFFKGVVNFERESEGEKSAMQTNFKKEVNHSDFSNDIDFMTPTKSYVDDLKILNTMYTADSCKTKLDPLSSFEESDEDLNISSDFITEDAKHTILKKSLYSNLLERPGQAYVLKKSASNGLPLSQRLKKKSEEEPSWKIDFHPKDADELNVTPAKEPKPNPIVEEPLTIEDVLDAEFGCINDDKNQEKENLYSHVPPQESVELEIESQTSATSKKRPLLRYSSSTLPSKNRRTASQAKKDTKPCNGKSSIVHYLQKI